MGGNLVIPDWIVAAAPLTKRRWFGSVFGASTAQFCPEIDLDHFVLTQTLENHRELQLITSAEQLRAAANRPSAILCRVRKGREPLSLLFSQILTDANGHAWDLEIRGAYWVADSRRLLTTRAAALVSQEVPFTREMTQTWMSSVVRSHVLDAVEAHTINELRDRDALPATWWSKHMAEWLDATGISIEIHECEWTSADAARAEVERRRLEEFARVEAEQEGEQQVLLRREKLEAEHADHRLRIEHDQRLSAAERGAQLQQAEFRHRAELLQIEVETEQFCQRKERAALEHELVVAQLTNNLRAMKEAEAQQAKLEDRHAEMTRLLAETNTALERLGNIPELLQTLVDRNERQAHQATERILSPEFASLGLNADMLAMLGYRVPVQSAWQFFANHAGREAEAVKISKSELRTRDVGTAKVKALKIGTTLSFSFESPRSGYVTMLNLGTSGRVWVHVPSGLRRPEAAYVEAWRRYLIPGPELFPWQHDYREEGPGGWEHIVVIVSQHPLINCDFLSGVTVDAPLLELSHDHLLQIVDTLAVTPQSWVSGIITFLVDSG